MYVHVCTHSSVGTFYYMSEEVGHVQQLLTCIIHRRGMLYKLWGHFTCILILIMIFAIVVTCYRLQCTWSKYTRTITTIMRPSSARDIGVTQMRAKILWGRMSSVPRGSTTYVIE